MDARDFTTERAIVIAGPTASGKSALALALAERLGGTLINADSMQVYADLSVLTARPGPADIARAPHRLFGHVDGAETYSVGRWLEDVRAELVEAWTSRRVPILVGGTGLYLKALAQGLSDIPPVPEHVRSEVRASAEGVPPDILHRRLGALDPETAARLKPTDPQRILRALEVLAATGKPLLSFQTAREPPLLPWRRIVGLFLDVGRADLNARIDARFDQMMKTGALSEVERLAVRALDPSLPVMRALGVPPLLAHRRGEVALDHAVAQGELLTRQYAKRQATFARHQLGMLPWVQPADSEREIMSRWEA